MRGVLLLGSIALLWTFGQPASAASVNDVLGACDRTAGCSYSQSKNGDITGCSPNACFYCAADGKRQCVGTDKGKAARAGKSGKGGVIDIGGVKIERGTKPNRPTASRDKATAAHNNKIKTTGNDPKTTTKVNRTLSNDRSTQVQQSGGGSKKH